MAQFAAEDLLASRRLNAIIGWLFIGFLGLVVVESIADVDIPWATFVLTILLLCILPPVAFRNWEMMLPWEVIVLAALPTFIGAIITAEVVTDFALYVSVAALALIVAVELDLFTEVEMTIGFAIAFVTVVTLAVAGAGAVFRWQLDLLLGTETLLDSELTDQEIHDAMMIEFIYSALAGVLGGIVFQLYFRRQQMNERVSQEVSER
jgi:hypothetical protein